MKLWYISFCGDDPERFLGGLHIWAWSLLDALCGAWSSGQNPGGEGLGMPLPPEIAARIPRHVIGRLLTLEELAALAAEVSPECPALVRVNSNGERQERE
jgi:hypothetical protein